MFVLLRSLIIAGTMAITLGWISPGRADNFKPIVAGSHIQTLSRDQVSAEDAHQIAHEINRLSEQHRISPLFLTGLIYVESRFNPNAVSPQGASGLMQVMPRIHRDKLKDRSVFNITDNLEVGIAILKQCFKRGEGDVRIALGCYTGERDLKSDLMTRYINRMTQAIQLIVKTPPS